MKSDIALDLPVYFKLMRNLRLQIAQIELPFSFEIKLDHDFGFVYVNN